MTFCTTRTVSSPHSDLCPRDPGSVAGELHPLHSYRYFSIIIICRCVKCTQCASDSPGINGTWQKDFTLCAPCGSRSSCHICSVNYQDGDLIMKCSLCKRFESFSVITQLRTLMHCFITSYMHILIMYLSTLHILTFGYTLDGATGHVMDSTPNQISKRWSRRSTTALSAGLSSGRRA